MSDYTSNAIVNLQMNGQQAEKVLDDLKTRAHNLMNAIAKAKSEANKKMFAMQVMLV